MTPTAQNNPQGASEVVARLPGNHACAVCGYDLSLVASAVKECPECGSLPGHRAFRAFFAQEVAPIVAQGQVPRLPLLCFGGISSEREILKSCFASLRSVSLFGEYGANHENGVDAQDLSRYSDKAFCGSFGMLTFDRINRQPRALAEAARVIGPGGVFFHQVSCSRLGGREKRQELPARIAWFVEAMERAGFQARHVNVPDPHTGEGHDWFIGIRRAEVQTAPAPVPLISKPATQGCLINMMRDAGRFGGELDAASMSVGAFAAPAWAGLAKGSTLASHAKFHRNSKTYGGTESAIDDDLVQLMEGLLKPPYRRFFPEFHVAKLKCGAETGGSISFPDGLTRYSQFHTVGLLHPVAVTTSLYMKVKAGDVGVRYDSKRRLFLDGVEHHTSIVVPSDSRWHHLVTFESANFSRHYRYSQDVIRLYAQVGDVALIAFPAMLPGHVVLPPDVGQIPRMP